MGIRLCDCTEPLPDGQQIRKPDFVLPFVAVLDRFIQMLPSFLRDSILNRYFPPVSFYNTQKA